MPTVRLGSWSAALAVAAAMLAVGCAHEAQQRPVIAEDCAHDPQERPAPPLPSTPAAAAEPSPAHLDPSVEMPFPNELAWPVHGKVGSKFGTRRGRHAHAGIDILAPLGTPVLAAAAGRVSFSGWMRGYGYVIFLEHDLGLETRYAHLRRMHVRKGAWIEQGRVIGEVGATGNATTTHLHFEVRERERATNPLARLERPDTDGGRIIPASLP